MSNKRPKNKLPTSPNKLRIQTTKQQSSQIVAQQIEKYQGPIPQAQELQKYENIQSCFAERIMKMAENESAHRQKIENKLINSDRLLNTVGQLTALCIGLSVVILMGYAFNKGFAEQVKWIGISIASVVGLFIFRRTKR